MDAMSSRAQGYTLPLREYTQNFQHHLYDRELAVYRSHVHVRVLPSALCYERRLQKCKPPNFTVQNVDKPLTYPRKFTPDGKYMISFSHDQHSLEVYQYQGVINAQKLLSRYQGEYILSINNTLEELTVRQRLFSKLFKKRKMVRLAPDYIYPSCYLNREFSIFLDNGRYVLVVSTVKSNNVNLPYSYLIEYGDLFDDVELFDYTFYLVEVAKCIRVDQFTMRMDNVALSHHHGVSVIGNMIAILSKCRQCIDIIECVNGEFTPLYCVGPQYFSPRSTVPVADRRDSCYKTLSHIKQRILAYMYREICSYEDAAVRAAKLKQFYKEFRYYERMIMTKIQYIDLNILLIRYEENPTRLTALYMHDYNALNAKINFKLYVFYHIQAQEVVKIYPRDSVELLYLLRDCSDQFRNVSSIQTRSPSSSPSNNSYFRSGFNHAIRSVPNGKREAAMRFNPTLPISTQSFATTLYMDYNLFKYDENLISAMERPRLGSITPIRFSDRNTNITNFRLYLETPSNKHPDVIAAALAAGNGSGIHFNRELVAFIFHPHDPLFISIQKLSSRYVVNIHVYNENTIVKP